MLKETGSEVVTGEDTSEELEDDLEVGEATIELEEDIDAEESWHWDEMDCLCVEMVFKAFKELATVSVGEKVASGDDNEVKGSNKFEVGIL